MTPEEAQAMMIAMSSKNKVKKLSESTARTTIAMMRSMASHIPISPFHNMASDQMESLLEEVLKHRSKQHDEFPHGIPFVTRDELERLRKEHE